jgi:N-acetylmuramic acid 6-phosphate etherase
VASKPAPIPEPLRGVTEQTNPRTRDLDTLGTEELLSRLLAEDATVASAVCRALPAMALACDALLATLEAGGRWFNLGAGTSGRIGVLDAAELPPTFGYDPDRVQGLIAGGTAALTRAVEGAEDDAEAGPRDLASRGLEGSDAVIGLSASGRTPYVIAGIEYARELGALSIGITCAPESRLACCSDISIVALVGPEAVTGSTRMKGGLAQKMILHSLSTAVMVRLGRVLGNQMVELQAVNSKLRDRAARIVMGVTGVDRPAAEACLEATGWSVSGAIARLCR